MTLAVISQLRQSVTPAIALLALVTADNTDSSGCGS
jgi:hypothetical protein